MLPIKSANIYIKGYIAVPRAVNWWTGVGYTISCTSGSIKVVGVKRGLAGGMVCNC